ncbi:MAG: hypothetical protein HFJ32_03510 [Clostridia bacterium]|nr:hypothetical protein [Clostridia bacterium]
MQAKLGLQYNPINKNKLKQLGFDYVALGHIHKLDYNTEENQRIIYPGSTISMGFDELGKHGFIVGELTKEKLEIAFIPVDNREFVELEMNITEINDLEQLIEKLNELLLDENKFYKVILVGKRKFEIDILELMKLITRENIIKIKNKTQPDCEIEKMINETTLKGIFIKQLLKEKENQNYAEEEINKILEIGLSIMEK